MGSVVYASNPSYLGDRDREDCGSGQPGQKIIYTLSQQNKLGMVSHASLPAAWEVIGRRITV
jgi:hypothetical protein